MDQLQWYPGHMTKARRVMEEDARLVDLFLELLDARAPYASKNPDIDRIAAGKARVILLNKADLADPAGNEAWTSFYRQQGYEVCPISAKSGEGMGSLSVAIQKSMKPVREKWARKGIKNRPVRAMVVGIPNVGKSAFINRYTGRACVKTGNRPGVTKGKQWIRIRSDMELLDTPGILWPKFEDQKVGEHLAFIGSIREELLNGPDLMISCLRLLYELYPELSEKKFGAYPSDGNWLPVLDAFAARQGCLKKGKEFDYDKAAARFFDELQRGALWRVTLEWPAERKTK